MELVLLAVILVLASAPLLLRWPVVATLGGYAFLLPFDTVLVSAVGQIHLHLTWLAGAASAGALLTSGLLGRGFVRPPKAALWLTMIVFWAVISSWWAMNTQTAIFRLPLLSLLLILYIAAVCVRVNQKELNMIGWLAILGGCVAAAVSLFEIYHGQSFLRHSVLPWSSPGMPETTGRETLSAGERATNPNTLAATLILPLSLALGWMLVSRHWPRRLLLMGLVALLGSSICATMSRGALLATAVVFLVYCWRSRARWRLAMPLTILGVVIIIAMPQIWYLRIAEAFADRGAGRLDIWRVALHAFGHRPILGAGLDCFPDAFNESARYALNFVGFDRAPHNTYLGTSIELGLVGLALLVGSIVTHFLIAAKTRHADGNELLHFHLVGYEAALWGLLACGFFLDLLWEEYFWLTLMLLIMGVRARRAVPGTAFLQSFTLIPSSPRNQ